MVQADATDEEALRALGILNFDVVVVAIGENLQANVLATLQLKEIGARYIVATARDTLQIKLLEKIGADRVVSPERDMARRVAYNLASTSVMRYLQSLRRSRWQAAMKAGRKTKDKRGSLFHRGEGFFSACTDEKMERGVLMKNRGFEISKGYEEKNIRLPRRKTARSAGYDIEAAADCELLPHRVTLVPTGIKAYMQPDEYLGIHDS